MIFRKRSPRSTFQRIFFPFSMTYLILGFEIDSPSDTRGRLVWWRRVRQIIMAPLFWIYLPFSFLFTVFASIESFQIDHLASYTYLLMACTFHLTSLAKSRQIRLFVKKSLENVSQRLRHILFALSCIFLFLHTNEALSITSMNLEYFNYTEKAMMHMVIGATCSYFEFIFYEIDLPSLSIYFAAILIHYNSIRGKTFRILESIRLNDRNSMINLLNSLQRDHDEFESLFNLNPLFWLLRRMCHAVLFLIVLQDSKTMTIAYSFIIQQSYLIVALLVIHFIRNKITAHGEQILEKYSGIISPTREASYYVCRLIDRAYNKDFTVWQMFIINRSLIASYISSVVTFSVLIVQIRNGALAQ